jgi:iron complex outermembrane receptor protein
MKMLICLLLCVNMVNAQTKTKLSGLLTDGNGKPLELVNISLLKAADSLLIKGSVTNALGKYTLDNIGSGKYILRMTLVGYRKKEIPVSITDAAMKELDMGTTVLEQQAQTLQEVTVSSQKPFMERKADRLVINIENSILATGNTGLELLEKLPGVLVDQNGNISLNGKGGIAVYINGKPTYLSSSDLASFLTGMNASQVEKVELITNPSSRFDAAGGAIINIKLKKDQRIGLNGNTNLSYGQGVFARVLGGVNLNYRSQKWNWYGGYNRTDVKAYTDITSVRHFNNGNVFFSQEGSQQNINKNHSVRLGMDLYASKKLTIGILLNSNTNHAATDAAYHTNMTTGTIVDSSLNSFNNNQNSWQNYAGNINLKYAIDSAGSELTFDFDYVNYNRNNSQFFRNEYLNKTGSLSRTPDTLINTFPGSLVIRSFKSDYSRSFRNNIKLEAGIKSSWVENDNNLSFYNRLNGADIINAVLSNHFMYSENINAVYISLAQENKKWGIQAGLRAEQTLSKGNQLSTSIAFKRNYVNLFPSLFISYAASDKVQYSFSYSRRVARPSYQVLNPYKRVYDPFNYEEGNPLLNPELSHSAELNLLYKSKLNIGLFYNYIHGAINTVVKQDDAKRITIITYDNLSTAMDGGISASYGGKITPWWSTNDFVAVFFNYYYGPYLSGQLNTFKPTFNLNSVNSFILSPTLTAELALNYLSGQQQGLLNIENIGWRLSPGIQKTFAEKKGTIKLSVSDLFKTRKWNYTTQFGNIDASYTSRTDSRVVTLSLGWKFGKKTVAQERKRKTSAEEEKGRVQF